MRGGVWSRVVHWVRAAAGRGRVEREMEEEIRFHLDARAAELAGQGLPEKEARRQARVEFGSTESHKHGMRAAFGLPWLDSVGADLRYGARMLNKSRGFTAVAVGSLALAIGANTAVFSAANLLIYAKLGVPRPGELRVLTLEGKAPTIAHNTWGNNSYENGVEYLAMFPYPVFREVQKRARSMETPVGFKDVYGLNVTANGTAQQAGGEFVSGNFYQAMELKPQKGRGLLPADAAVPDAGAVAVIGDGFWLRAFGGAKDVVGRVLSVNGNLVTIVGVNPPSYTGAEGSVLSPDIVMPLTMINRVSPVFGAAQNLLSSPDVWWLDVMARRKAGVPDRQAAAELSVLFKAAVRGSGMSDIKPDEHSFDVLVADGSRGLRELAGGEAKPVYVLLAMTGLVLLLACANIANLMLARAGAREREMQVRLALGASRMRVLRQAMTESLLLAGLGGGLGLLLAFSLRNALPKLLLPGFVTGDHAIHVPFDGPVFGFAAGVTLLTGLLFGLLPAWRSARGELQIGLKEGGYTATRRRGQWSGRGLVIAQVMLATLLVSCAALFTRTLTNLYHVDPGFKTDGLLQFNINALAQRYPGRAAVDVLERIKAAVQSVPGVQAATLADVALLSGSQRQDFFDMEGAPKVAKGENREAYLSEVDEHFFSVMGIRLLRGHGFTAADTAEGPKVSVVNETLARRYFPGRDPIGRRFRANHDVKNPVWITIVGVCADTAYSDLTQEQLPIYFGLYRQTESFNGGTYLIRSPLPTSTLVPALRKAVQAIDRDLPLTQIRTMNEQIALNLFQQRLFASLTAAFGLLALVLACVGVYGVMAYTVAQRTHEIGIRLALGAPTGQVRWMVLREALWLGLAGVAAGLGAALALARLVESLLYGLKPRDPASLAGAALVLLSVALLAGWVPAVRASRVDPMQALRHE